MAVTARQRSAAFSKLVPASVSEYDVTPGSAPLLLVGELWGALHERGMRLRALEPGDCTVSPAGIARISAAAKVLAGGQLEPKTAAMDLIEALTRYSPEDARALLGGYSRLGYELLDRDRPGFTDALLDCLEVPDPRPQSATSPIDFSGLMRGLRIDLRFVGDQLAVVLLEESTAENVWTHAPREAFQLIAPTTGTRATGHVEIRRSADCAWRAMCYG